MSDDTYTDTAETTTLGIRIPEDLRAKIREAAKLEERTESGFARYYLNKAADAALAQLEAKPDA